MSALGQKQTCAMQLAMLAKGQKRTFGFTVPRECPLLVISRHLQCKQPCPLYPNSDRESGFPQSVMPLHPWRKYSQPSYNLDSKNCVTFVKEIAIALRLPASNDAKFIRDPRGFLEDLQLRTSKTNRIVATARPDPSANTKTQTVITGAESPTPQRWHCSKLRHFCLHSRTI